MRKSTEIVLVVFFAVQLGCTSESSKASESGSGAETGLHVADLQSRPMIGELGQPLGTVVTIEGRFKDMTFTRVKADDGRIVMIAEAVNGNLLNGPKRFDFRRPNWDERDLKPEDGERFRITGYEAGGFLGHVEGESDHERMWAAQTFEPFGFRSSFHVRSIEEPERMQLTLSSQDAE